MGVGQEIPPIPTVFEGANKRRAGRVRLMKVRSTLGEVLDVSVTGCRLRSRRRPRCSAGDVLELAIVGLDGPIGVRARVAWVRRAGLRAHELGVHFVEPDSESRRALALLARTAPSNETFHRAVTFRREDPLRRAG
jgi:hypothetical protein